MKKLKIFLPIILILLLNSCGFKKLNSEKINNFNIVSIEINGEFRSKNKLKNNFLFNSTIKSPNEFDIKIDLSQKKEQKIKNSAGVTIRYGLSSLANTEIIDKKTQKKYIKLFISSNDYDIGSAYSETLKRETETIDNNLNNLYEQIIKYIKLINLGS